MLRRWDTTIHLVGRLHHSWSFEDDYTDIIGGISTPASDTVVPVNFTTGVCGRVSKITSSFYVFLTHMQAIVASNSTGTRYSLHYNFTDVTYQNDFTISLWMYLEGNQTNTYAIIGQRL